MKNVNLSFILLVLLFFVVSFVTYTVDEKETVVITQMGKPVGERKEPGIYFKLPYPIQTLHVFDDRLLEYDSAPTEIITQDKKKPRCRQLRQLEDRRSSEIHADGRNGTRRSVET